MASRAILFDLDGTLLDSLEDLADSMNAVLARAGLPEHPLARYRHFVGEGIELLVRRALPEGRFGEPQTARFVEEMREEYGRRAADKTRPYPGVPELLDELERRSLPAAVLSNKPHDATVDLVQRLLARWKFRAVLGARPGVPRKPDPAGAREVAEALGLTSSEILYVGDTPTDMRTAVAAGMPAVGVLWGFRTAAELLEAGAEALAAEPWEILAFLAPAAVRPAQPASVK